MWLLNHTTARNFEVPMLKRLGVQEIFLPKRIPSDPSFRSASIDWSEDANLTIPGDQLDVLNAADWYDDPGFDAWRIANEHFDAAFFIIQKTVFFKSMARHFHGAKIWRTYGLPKLSYDDIVAWLSRREGPLWSSTAAQNLWFGQAYEHLAEVEPRHVADRAVFLPAGLPDADVRDEWIGSDKRIFFVCPDLAFTDLYQDAYEQFKRTFRDLPYAVAGAQPVAVKDEHVLGFLPIEQHRRNMREFAVMYYHGTEPNHVHYHPFEAVRAGMPLVFQAGGLLDRLGGVDLPGRCKTANEARKKVARVLAGDRKLIESIRRTQTRLLARMRADYCEPIWRKGFQRILDRLAESRRAVQLVRAKKKRIAVIVPIGYRGGSLRGAKLLARAIQAGGREQHGDVEVVFGHLDDPVCYPNEEFEDLPPTIERRPYVWRTMSYDEASRACIYGGIKGRLTGSTYIIPDDGMNQFMDCDLWIVISDRLSHPLLPVRPYLLMVYDYLQRYQPVIDDGASQQFINRAHAAEAIMVTTDFTAKDAIQFAGVPAAQVKKVPMLAPEFSVDAVSGDRARPRASYFIWTTNLGSHKNHLNALKALRYYYEKYEGTLECRVTGVDTRAVFKRDLAHLIPLRDIRRSSPVLKRNLRLEGELPDRSYRVKLREAAFLWHPGRIDNGTFSVVEAASLGVPALSSDYPAMREIDRQFILNLTWTDPVDPAEMAEKLKQMENEYEALRARLPSAASLSSQSSDRLGGEYWNVVREYL
jgi:glycosyltransferase involved in cell wall biosynthesis